MKDLRRILICLVLLAIVLAGTGYAARRGYVSLRQARLLKQARASVAKNQDRKAILFLKRALRANPKDVQAARLMAELLEKVHSPEAFLWRSRVLELAPTSIDDRLALARIAILAGDAVTATNTLAAMSEAGQKTFGFQNLAGTIDTAIGKVASAEEHFLEASRLAPTNPIPQLNLAVIRLQQTNGMARAEARATLEHLSTNAFLSCQALRELVSDAMRHRNTNDAVSFAHQLIHDTSSTFNDRLLQLEVLRGAKNNDLPKELAKLQAEAAKDSAKAYELGTWKAVKNGPAEAVTWLQSLPQNVSSNQPVPLLLAECQVAIQDWKNLETSLEAQNWAELEFLRLAFVARAMRAQELTSSAKTEWEKALSTAKGRKETLVLLLRLTGQWKWTTESEQILWMFIAQFPSEKWAPSALVQLLYVRGRTEALLTLFRQLASSSPNDLGIKNNLAAVSLLLDQQPAKAYDLAQEVYQKAPTNSVFASTYAFSLYLQQKQTEALKVMEQLPPADLDTPQVSGYYALLLQAAGEKEKATKYFDIAAKAPLLPEERKLFERARSL